MQRSCNIQLQTAVEKSGVRESPRRTMREMVRLGGEVKVYHTVSDLKGPHSAWPDFLRRDPGSISVGE